VSASLNDKLEAYFRSRPNEWIDGRELARVAGSYAWRTRVSDIRKRGMTIENNVQRVPKMTELGTCQVSVYRYVPDLPTRVEPSGQVAFL
jgi:hypothetical protein